MTLRVAVLFLLISVISSSLLILSFFRFIYVSSPIHDAMTQRSVEIQAGRLAFIKTQWEDEPPAFRAWLTTDESPFARRNIPLHVSGTLQPKPGWIYKNVEYANGGRVTGVAVGLAPLAAMSGMIAMLLFVKRRYWTFPKTKIEENDDVAKAGNRNA
jgi:hypothetical protein